MSEIMDKMKKVFGFSEEYDYEDYEENFPEERNIEDVPIRTTKRKSDSGVLSLNASNMIISVHEPLSYDESPNIVDDLRADKSVVLNFEQLDLEVKRKIFDFVSGALYAMDGKYKK